jgi:carbonic anhydrase
MIYCLLVASVLFITCSAQTTGSGMVVQSGDWSYTGSNGPNFWGSVNPLYTTCGTGTQQSPLDIATSPPFISGSPSILLRASTLNFASVVNNFQFNCAEPSRPCGTLQYAGTTYTLANVHFHSPSEHRLNGVQYPLEGHLVHRAVDGRVAVVAVLFDSARNIDLFNTNLVIQSLLSAAAARSNTFSFIPRLFNPAARLCTVLGSLTAPPCTEGVRWFISTDVLSVSDAQVAAYRTLVGSPTSRPLQGLNGRLVQCFS